MSTDRATWLASLPRRWTAAALLLTDETGRILLVEPSYRPDWLQPGGTTEAGETPAEACAREVLEELGLSLPVGRLLVLDHLRGSETGDATHFVYEGGQLPPGAEITVQAEELLSWAFVAPADLEARTLPRVAARLRAALQARELGTVVELESSVARP